MTNSKQTPGLIGPSLIAITISETLNIQVWATNIPAGIHLNGTLLFVAGLSIVRAHNLWIHGWPVVVTLAGWITILMGLFRMLPQKLYLEGVRNTSSGVIASTMVVLAMGIFLTFKAYWPAGQRKTAVHAGYAR